MQSFTRGLAEVGASVLGVGDTPARALPPRLRDALDDYLQVPSSLDEADVTQRLERWLRGPLRAASREWPEGLEGLLRKGPVRAVQHAWQTGHLHWSRPWALAALSGWRLAS